MPDQPDEFAALREAVWLNGPMFPLTVKKMEVVLEWARKWLAVDDLLAKHDVPALLATIRAATPGPWGYSDVTGSVNADGGAGDMVIDIVGCREEDGNFSEAARNTFAPFFEAVAKLAGKEG